MSEEKPQEPEWIKDQDLPEVIEQYRLGDNIRDENGNIIYNSDVIRYLQSIFGDGSDGNVDVNTNTNLITDMFYDNLTIKAGKILYPSGYRIFVKNKLTIEATAKIARNGNDGSNGVNGSGYTGGSGGNGGVELSSGSLYGALAGKNGGTGGGSAGGGTTTGGAGVAGDDLAKCLGSNGVAGGAGGASGYAGGAAGAGGSKTGTVYNFPRGLTSAYMLYDTLPATGSADGEAKNYYYGDVLKSNPGAGSGGGGGRGVNYGVGGGGGGGSASGAGIIEIFAKNIVNNGIIEVKGGKGGDGGNGSSFNYPTYQSGAGGGGAGGGNGGIIMLVYISKTGTGTIDVSGGAKGNKGLKGEADSGDGYDGIAGVAGKTFELKV